MIVFLLRTEETLMRDPADKHERVNQKRRTRAAVLNAALELVRQGRSPSIHEAADAANVSRATAYRYFSTQEHLLAEVTLEAALDLNQVVEGMQQVSDPEKRLDLLVQAAFKLHAANEATFRTMLRLSLEPPSDVAQDSERQLGRLRGGRRMDWIEEALTPAQGHLDPQSLRYLVVALALCTGIEALIVLRDICDLDPVEAEEVLRWTARTLLRGSLAEERRGLA